MRRPWRVVAILCVSLVVGLPVATAEVIQRDGTRVSVEAAISPRRLPRERTAPIHFSFSTKIASTDGTLPPQLRNISVEINRNGRLDPSGLPVCAVADIQPATTSGALAACRSSLVGEGSFAAKVLIAQQAPFPSNGKILAFNGRWHGQPAILAHIYGAAPVPTSYTLPFTIRSAHRGTYGIILSTSLPEFTSRWGYVTAISLNLGRNFSSRGIKHSYLSAACPAPNGFSGASFLLARGSFSFRDAPTLTSTLTRNCSVRG
jgi:hypothetical protein